MRRALAASLAASLIAGLTQLCLVPMYVGWMGIEAWGIIGFQLALMGLVQVFDVGMATTLNHAMAADSGERQNAHELFRVLEVIYLIEGVLIALALVIMASWLAGSWLSPVSLSRDAVRLALWAMTGVIFGQWMCGLYVAGLLGQERFQQVATIKIASTVIGHGGNVIALIATGGSLTAFLAWQGIFSILLAGAYRMAISSSQSTGHGPLRWRVLVTHWRFASGMGVIGITAVLIMNLDKVVLSRLLSLAEFGHYSLALTVVGGLALIIIPIFNITFPRLSALAQTGDRQALVDCYLQRSQLMAWLVLPAAAVMTCASRPLLVVWTGKEGLAVIIAPLVSLAVLGTAANALMNVPFALQLARGRTNLGVALNLLMLSVLIPGLFLIVPRWGAAGGAALWAICNGLYLLVGLPITHNALLPGVGRSWCAAVLPVALAAVVLPVGFAWWHPVLGDSRWLQAFFLATLGLGSLTLAAWCARLLFPQGPFVVLLKTLRLRQP
jgi:O-antigen/teichoic acid export membrane protein